MIEIINLNKTFQSKNTVQTIFKDFNLSIRKGEFVTVLGPNGCGKSTLFNLIIGVDCKYTGSIKVNDSGEQSNQHIGYMPQKDLLLPWLTVLENIKLGSDIQKLNKRQVNVQMNNYMEGLNISHLKNEYPSRLSGGERQKVAFIRTIILGKKILLLDEPFSAIDYNTRIELQSAVLDYVKKHNTTVVLISHDIDEAVSMSDRVIILDYKPNGVKLDLPVKLNIGNRNPISVRKHPQFANYFGEIWNKYPRK